MTTRTTTPRPADANIDYRSRRNRNVIGMLGATILMTAISYPLLHSNQSLTVERIADAITGMFGLVIIIFFAGACRNYARLRGYAGIIGILGWAVGMAVWIGIGVAINWPTIEAIVNGTMTPEWQPQSPFAPWAGFAVAGLLLKALPDRRAGAAGPVTQE